MFWTCWIRVQIMQRCLFKTDYCGTHWGRIGDARGTHWGRIGDALWKLWELNRDALSTHWGRIGDALGTHWGHFRDSLEPLHLRTHWANIFTALRNKVRKLKGAENTKVPL